MWKFRVSEELRKVLRAPASSAILCLGKYAVGEKQQVKNREKRQKKNSK